MMSYEYEGKMACSTKENCRFILQTFFNEPC